MDQSLPITDPSIPLVPSSSPPPISTPPHASYVPKLLVVAILFLTLGLGVGFTLNNYLSTPNPTPTPVITTSPSPAPDLTANWKTYTNTESGVEFKYPQTWDAKQLIGWQLNVFLDDHPFEIPTATEFLTPILISLNEAQNTVTNQKYFQEKTIEEGIKRISYLFDQSSITVKNLTIDGKKAVQLSGITAPGMLGGQFYMTTLIQLDNKLLLISLHDQKFQKTYDQILSTFRFLE